MKRLFLNQELNPHYSAEPNQGQGSMHEYRVTKIVNAVEPYVGKVISRDQVIDMNNDADWNVTITVT